MLRRVITAHASIEGNDVGTGSRADAQHRVTPIAETRHQTDRDRGRFRSETAQKPRCRRGFHRARGRGTRFFGGQAQFRPNSERRFGARPHSPGTEKTTTRADSAMARPGLEPGTPRFSVVRSGLAGGA